VKKGSGRLANVSKHAEARQTWIDIRHTDAALSPREREVLALIAEGRSNAAIAQRMVITERAVAKHTASIFGKLDLQPSDDDNRRALAVLAYLGG
jgi:DNA-binding NarL/FixJ family response regulator